MLIGLRTLAALRRIAVEPSVYEDVAEGDWLAVFAFAEEPLPLRCELRRPHADSLQRDTEDPATGSTNTAFAAHLRSLGAGGRFIVEQGFEIDRPARLYLDVSDPIRVGGQGAAGAHRHPRLLTQPGFAMTIATYNDFVQAVHGALWTWADRHHLPELDGGKREGRPAVLMRHHAARNVLIPSDETAADEIRAAIPESRRHQDVAGDVRAEAIWREEKALLARMEETAATARGLPDAKTCHLIGWIREHLCLGLPPWREQPPGNAGFQFAAGRRFVFGGTSRRPGQSLHDEPSGVHPPRWNDRRVLIFTENVGGTKRYLRTMLEQAIAGTELAEDRIETIDGQTVGAKRKEVQRRFNTDPTRDPLRILIATDAAREGLNFQAHCTDLFHFDLPWNPGRIEQRNGRIDRKLQPAPEVRCHYFVLPQRTEDRVLDVLVRKTETIKRELGSLSKVIDDDIECRLHRGGIRHRDADRLAREIEAADLDRERKRVAAEELEAARERQEDLKAQIERCRGLLERSRRWVQFEAEPFRDAMSCSLELAGASPLQEDRTEDGGPVWTFPPLDGKTQADASWTATLDTLRSPRKTGQKLAEWRREAPIRPVVFEDAGVLTDDTVHLHLEQRMAQRLLARFRSQGFVHHDLSRACLVQAADSIPRVILLGRLCLFGRRAERLHEVLTPVAARWIEPTRRGGPLRAYAEEAEARTLERLEAALQAARTPGDTIRRRLLDTAAQDIEDLLPQLEERAEAVARTAADRLRERGEREERQLRETLEDQRRRVETELRKQEAGGVQLAFEFNESEKRQREADIASWRTRLAQFDRDLETEPARIRDFYEVRASRVEPIGLVYLWPDTG